MFDDVRRRAVDAYPTRELAEIAGTTLKTVRQYHRIGLLEEPERAVNGYKQYGIRHLGRFIARWLRGERLVSAVGSLLGVAVAAGIVAWTGSARDFFVIGIWASLAGFVVTVGSVLARRPLTGVVWNALHGGTHAWRSERAVRVAHDVATLAAASVFGSRFAVQQWLYLTDSTGGLGLARVVMGTPLTVLAALVVLWSFRRSTRRLVTAGA
ncbi:DUF3159 domain-containing protein [Micromonospora maritima]|uniref:DUF3159 domain-containing protein n=1 Tax=Micromonospora maritima TaxID=986711 RepID=A0ABW7ZU81_9ACTN